MVRCMTQKRVRVTVEREPAAAPPPPPTNGEHIPQASPVVAPKPPWQGDVWLITRIMDVVRIPLTLDQIYVAFRNRYFPMALAFYRAHRPGFVEPLARKIRLAKCSGCHLRRGDYCKPTQQSCGCAKWPASRISWRSRLRSWSCPLGHWDGDRGVGRAASVVEAVAVAFVILTAALVAGRCFGGD